MHVNGAEVVVGRVGVDALLDRRGEHERLERRAGLARRLRGEVELVAVGPHDRRHRADRAGARLDRDDRRGRIGLVRKDVADRLVREPLQARIDRRVDLEPALAHRVGAVLALELVDHVGEEVRLLDARVDPARLQVERARPDRAPVLAERDVATREHRAQHLVAAVERRLRIVERVVDRRRLRQPGEQRRLQERQLDARASRSTSAPRPRRRRRGCRSRRCSGTRRGSSTSATSATSLIARQASLSLRLKVFSRPV